MKRPDATPATVPVRNGDIVAWAHLIVRAMVAVCERQKRGGASAYGGILRVRALPRRGGPP